MPEKKDTSKPKTRHENSTGSSAGTAEDADKPFPIVIVGASAGGLQALEAFFEKLPLQSGLAIVVLTHTMPDKPSMLPEIIKKKVKVRVQVIENGMAAEMDTIYIPPTDRDPVIKKGIFQLQERPQKGVVHMPIDLFCRCLSLDRGERAGCAILSGTGTDGTQGVRMIKEKGGLVAAQDHSARHAGMPQSAIDTGLVDFVSNPADMAPRLIEYFKNPVNLTVDKLEDDKEPESLRRILSVLSRRTRHDFSLYKSSTLIRRIERRMTVTQCSNVSEYLKHLHHHPGETLSLFQDLLIGVTNFFRDPEAFSYLQENVIPKIIERTQEGDFLRVWVAGCSTGEEALSVAIAIVECLEEKKLSRQLQIFATDIDPKAIESARRGVYLQNISADVSEERLERFFKIQGDYYQTKGEIREMVVFAEQNLLRDPPFSSLDLLVCRNLLIYLKPEAQNKLLPLFHYSLKNEGILFLGTSESIGRHPDLFQPIHKSFSIYQKKNSLIRPKVVFPTSAAMVLEHGHEDETKWQSPSKNEAPKNLAQDVESLLLKEHTPVCVIVNQGYDIVYVHGRTGKYLEPPSGRPTNKITEMAREGVRFPLLSALRRAIEYKDQPVLNHGLKVKTNGDYQTIDLTVKCLSQQPFKDCLMVLFEDRPEPDDKPEAAGDGGSDEQRIKELEDELMRVNQDYRGALEELEASNEELRSLNEEMHSSNEELQSTNEELDSSREELQSLNEELSTVNAELHDKIRELNDSYNAVTHVLNSTRIALVFLDTELKVQRFTSEGARLINLIDADIGRPIDHIAHNLDFDDLGKSARQVLDTLSRFEDEVRTKEGSWYRMAIMVHRTEEHILEGVVMTFINIDSQKKAQEEIESITRKRIHSAESFAENIIETVRESMLVLDMQMRVITANRSFYQTFKVRPEETEGYRLFDLGNGQWDIASLRELLDQIVNEDKIFEEYLVEHNFEQIGEKRMLLNARQLREENNQGSKILLAIDDITGKNQAGDPS